MRVSSLLQSAAVGLSVLGQVQAHGDNITETNSTSPLPIFEKVAACAQVDLDTESCLVSATVALAASGMMTPSQSLGDGPFSRALSEDVIICERPDLNDVFIRELVNAAKDHCVTIGQEVHEIEVNQTIAVFEEVISSEECWDSVCSVPVGELEDQVYDEFSSAVGDITAILSERVAPCAGIQLDPESCLVSTTIELIFMESVSGLSGMRRALEDMEMGNETTGFCTPPQIDTAGVHNFVSVAQQKCTDNGFNASTHDVDETAEVLSKLFNAEQCWTTLCDDVNGTEIPDIPTILFDQLSTCAEVELDPESCLVSTAVDMLFTEAVAGVGGMRARRMLYEEEGVGPADACGPPVIDESMVQSIMYAAQEKCVEMGTEVDALEVNATTAAIVTLLEADQCWTALCSEVDVGITEVENEIANMFMTNEALMTMALEYVTSCADVELDDESCLETSLVDMLLSKDAPDGMGMHRHLGQTQRMSSSQEPIKISTGGEFGNQETEHTYDEYTNNESEECGPPISSEEAIGDMITMATQKCMLRGIQVDENELQETTAKLTKLMNADHCWESLCSEETGGMIMGKYMEQCASIDLPFAMLNPDVVKDSPESYLHDIKVTCMLNYVMSTTPSEFGLPDPPENSAEMCYPPGHENMEHMCPAVIGPMALRHCSVDLPDFPDFPDPDFPDLPDFPEEPMSYDYEISMSYAYEWPEMDWGFSLEYPGGDNKDSEDDHDVEWPDMDWDFSMDTGFSMDYGSGDNDDEDGDNEDNEKAVDHLCRILSQMSSDKGKSCLAPLCAVDVPGNEDEDEDDDDFKIFKSSAPSSTPETISPTLSPITMNPTSETASFSEPTSSPVGMPTTTATPTALPSSGGLVTSAPTASPTSAPSTMSPTATPENGVVEVKFEAEITLNGLNISDIPTGGDELQAMVSVLKDVLAQFLPKDAEARIISIGGIRVAQRRRLLRILQSDGVDVEFEVIIKKECSDASCSDSANLSSELYDGITGELGEAVSSGNLTASLQEKAAEEGVPALEKAAVKEDSFSASEPITEVRTVEKDNGNDDYVGSGATPISFSSTLIVLLVSAVLPLLDI